MLLSLSQGLQPRQDGGFAGKPPTGEQQVLRGLYPSHECSPGKLQGRGILWQFTFQLHPLLQIEHWADLPVGSVRVCSDP